MPHSHQAGNLKQSNKSHKGRSSKREAKRGFGAGQVSSEAKRGKKSLLDSQLRRDRLNARVQQQKQKREEKWLEKRLGTTQGPPKIIGIVPISQGSDAAACLHSLLSEASWKSSDWAPGSAEAPPRIIHAHFKGQRMRCMFLTARDRELDSVLALAKVVDVLVMAVHCTENWIESMFDDDADMLISSLKAVGMPEVVCCLQGVETLPPKKRKDMKRDILRNIDSTLVPDIRSYEVPMSSPAASATIAMDTCDNDIKLLNGDSTVAAAAGGGGGAAAQMIRGLSGMAARTVQWRSIRSYMVTEEMDPAPAPRGSSEGAQAMRLRGYLRGRPLSVNHLMHVLGVGTARILSVTNAASPFDHVSRKGHVAGVSDNDRGVHTVEPVAYADPIVQDSLVLEAIPDTLAGEQTWPTVEEIAAAEAGNFANMNVLGEASDTQGDRSTGRDRRRTNNPVNVPAGMSDYQADWFIDEAGEWEGPKADVEDGEEEHRRIVGAAEAIADDGDDMTLGGSVLDEPDSKAFDVEEKRALAKRRAEEAQEHLEFPDEIDTPLDMAARKRFARFRALQSFRSSPWHPKENLPFEYSRIFQFANFSLTQKEVLSDSKAAETRQNQRRISEKRHAKSVASDDMTVGSAMDCGDDVSMSNAVAGTGDVADGFFVPGSPSSIQSGQYVEIVIMGDAADAGWYERTRAEMDQQSICAAFSVLPHENKLSVLHFNVTRCDDPSDTSADAMATEGGKSTERVIRSKDELIFHAGFRTFKARPVFSESNLNCDKHKFERFLHPHRFAVASCYGPASFIPTPVLVFKQEGTRRTLVASGNLASVDPDRIMLKKVILTGYPMRIKKKFAVVKHMFYQADDVRWFRPAELVTKFGLRGNIRESLGNKGLFKAIFSAPIKQNDTVMLVLYKRVFPKFPSDRSIH